MRRQAKPILGHFHHSYRRAALLPQTGGSKLGNPVFYTRAADNSCINTDGAKLLGADPVEALWTKPNIGHLNSVTRAAMNPHARFDIVPAFTFTINLSLALARMAVNAGWYGFPCNICLFYDTILHCEA
ncbi:MAG: hypothetical protein IH624_10250 [Phycisphaerae bacterium]|nr:hypothetical protein [Phycisphaerae bacterium]